LRRPLRWTSVSKRPAFGLAFRCSTYRERFSFPIADRSVLQTRPAFAKDTQMARVKKSIKSRSKEKRKALKRKRIRRKKSLRKGTRGK
jgi:hypothetical protein